MGLIGGLAKGILKSAAKDAAETVVFTAAAATLSERSVSSLMDGLAFSRKLAAKQGGWLAGDTYSVVGKADEERFSIEVDFDDPVSACIYDEDGDDIVAIHAERMLADGPFVSSTRKTVYVIEKRDGKKMVELGYAIEDFSNPLKAAINIEFNGWCIQPSGVLSDYEVFDAERNMVAKLMYATSTGKKEAYVLGCASFDYELPAVISLALVLISRKSES